MVSIETIVEPGAVYINESPASYGWRFRPALLWSAPDLAWCWTPPGRRCDRSLRWEPRSWTCCMFLQGHQRWQNRPPFSLLRSSFPHLARALEYWLKNIQVTCELMYLEFSLCCTLVSKWRELRSPRGNQNDLKCNYIGIGKVYYVSHWDFWGLVRERVDQLIQVFWERNQL